MCERAGRAWVVSAFRGTTRYKAHRWGLIPRQWVLVDSVNRYGKVVVGAAPPFIPRTRFQAKIVISCRDDFLAREFAGAASVLKIFGDGDKSKPISEQLQQFHIAPFNNSQVHLALSQRVCRQRVCRQAVA